MLFIGLVILSATFVVVGTCVRILLAMKKDKSLGPCPAVYLLLDELERQQRAKDTL